MKRLLLALLLVAWSACVYAEGDSNGNSDNIDPATRVAAAASYVKGAYNKLNEEKIGTTITQQMNGNTITGNVPDGSIITNVSVNTTTNADNKTETTGITVQRSNVKIPHHSATSTSSYSGIWIE